VTGESSGSWGIIGFMAAGAVTGFGMVKHPSPSPLLYQTYDIMRLSFEIMSSFAIIKGYSSKKYGEDIFNGGFAENFKFLYWGLEN